VPESLALGVTFSALGAKSCAVEIIAFARKWVRASKAPVCGGWAEAGNSKASLLA